MAKKKKTKAKIKAPKINEIFLSPNQVGHLIDGAINNMVDLKIHADEEGFKFLIVLDCVVPDGCIPVTQEPKSHDEDVDILCAHLIAELFDFVEVALPIRQPDGKVYRGFSTHYITQENMSEFVDRLSEIEDHWAEIDQDAEDEEDLKGKIKGKNVMEGNSTVN